MRSLARMVGGGGGVARRSYTSKALVSPVYSGTAAPAASEGDAAALASPLAAAALLPPVVQRNRPAWASPFADSGGRGAGVVASVAARGARRVRENLADISLDKEASIASGEFTPTASAVSAADAAAEAEGGGGSGARMRAAFVGPEALSRIERSFSVYSPATRAAVSAVVVAKRASNAARAAAAAAARSGGVENPVARLAALVDTAAASGLFLRLSPAEQGLLDAARTANEIPPAAGGATTVPFVRARPADPAMRVSPLLDEGSRLLAYTGANFVQLAGKARAIRSATGGAAQTRPAARRTASGGGGHGGGGSAARQGP